MICRHCAAGRPGTATPRAWTTASTSGCRQSADSCAGRSAAVCAAAAAAVEGRAAAVGRGAARAAWAVTSWPPQKARAWRAATRGAERCASPRKRTSSKGCRCPAILIESNRNSVFDNFSPFPFYPEEGEIPHTLNMIAVLCQHILDSHVLFSLSEFVSGFTL
jgi:hypothetical protein